MMSTVRYLTARMAREIDEELMSQVGAFSLDQLMELAGLSCAQALANVYSRETHRNVLVCCGPGNQGGDGLVAARHLAMFGYRPVVYMPKFGSKDIYKRLHRQCDNMEISTLPPDIPALEVVLPTTNVILDAIFGFSFQGPVRAPFDAVLDRLQASGKPVVSVDIPSGWDVEKGPDVEARTVIRPEVLVSLTAPKEGARKFRGRHFLGGRFVPRSLERKYELNLPEYPGAEQVVELPLLQEVQDAGGQHM
ncbi:YjeF N-terminal domain-like protein [Pisolithus croceorrhizus]|nr:YjeF N-terminal domain-like protein [Pisolithus croceorrhizus]KAI6141968.1 YjeF N-terminal domain-like protein [Pisolithus thermaeus]